MARKVAKNARREPVDRLFAAMNGYLSSIGWNAVVAGPVKVQSQPGAPAFKYELVINFLGGPVKKAEAAAVAKRKRRAAAPERSAAK